MISLIIFLLFPIIFLLFCYTPHSQFGEFRPIFLAGSLYKLLYKVLVDRLYGVMDNIISPNQSVLLNGKLLVDGVVDVNELVDLSKKSKIYCLIFKVDFEKPYDLVSWSFLDYMFYRFGFSDKWRG